jgi:hypothetical protein
MRLQFAMRRVNRAKTASNELASLRRCQIGLGTLLVLVMLLGSILGLALQRGLGGTEDKERREVLAEWHRIWNLDASSPQANGLR